MDCKTGRIYSEQESRRFDDNRMMEIKPTPIQAVRGRVSRNDPCPCGSGKKFKKCCRLKYQ